MKILTIALLVVTFQLVPVALHACDCGCGDENPPPFHFKDGIAPNGPSNTEAIYADPAYYKCTFAFRNYGAVHAVVPPPPIDTKDMKRPGS